MLKNDKKASDAVPDEQATASVFDFLYNDGRRVGSLLAQLDDNGLLTEIRQGEKVSKGAKRGLSLTGTVLGTGGGMQVTPKEGGGESTERIYDPFWANARELLDALDSYGMIQRDLNNAPLGSIVLLSGSIKVVDLSLLKELWQLPSVRKLMQDGINRSSPSESRQVRRAKDKKQVANVDQTLPPEFAMLLEMLPVLPHSLTVMVDGGVYLGWGNLREEYLIGTGSDIVMKHGESIPGEWRILGVLDAHPDEGGQADVEANNLIDFTDESRLINHSLVGQFASIMSPIFRMLLGRPGTHHGVTPLLIFREVVSG